MGNYRGGCCEKLLEDSQSPKSDPPLAKVESIGNSGSTSAITYFKRGKNFWATSFVLKMNGM